LRQKTAGNRRPLSTEVTAAFSKGVLLPSLIAALEELRTISKLAGIFVRKVTRQRVAFSFVQDGSKPKPNRFELPRQIVKWAEAIKDDHCPKFTLVSA
jgi:hypothetical protein